MKAGNPCSIQWADVLILLTVGLFVGCQRSDPANRSTSPTAKPKGINAKLAQIGIAVEQYHNKTITRFPHGGSLTHGGMRYRAWQVELLPFVDQQGLYARIDTGSRWDSESNRPVFETTVPQYLRDKKEPKRDGTNYALTQIAGNSHLFPRRSSLGIRDCTDGTSNTLMIGEIGSDYPPWARPGNVRKPEGGLGGTGDQFGRPDGTGAAFLICDGSVRFVSSKVDPAVLKALATPNDGEDIEGLISEAKKGTPATVTNKDRFLSTYSLESHEGLVRVISPPPFRTEVIASEWKVTPTKTSYPSPPVIEPWFSVSEQLYKAGNTIKNKLVNPPRTGEPPVFCIFKHHLSNSDPLVSGRHPVYHLVKTGHAWKLADICEVTLASSSENDKWFPDQLVFNTPNMQEPDFGFRGDILIGSNYILDDLEEYCENGPKHLHGLKFRIEKKIISSVSGISPDWYSDSYQFDRKPKEYRQRTYENICRLMGVSPFRSEELMSMRAIGAIDLKALPIDPTQENAVDESSLTKESQQNYEAAFRSLLSKVNAGNKYRSDPQKTLPVNRHKLPVVECYRESD